VAGLPPHLQDPITFLYLSGWRVSEALSLEWRNVDIEGQVIRLSPAQSKTKDGRLLPIEGALVDVMTRAQQNRRLDYPFAFHHGGRRIGTDIRVPWRKACAAAGLGKTLVHDLRRTAIRDMVRAGIPEKIAMSVSGHKTRAIFDRYDIVNESDLRNAVKRRDQYLEGRPAGRRIVPLR
jgi:integrase